MEVIRSLESNEIMAYVEIYKNSKIYLKPPEKVGAWLDLEPVVVEVLSSLLDLPSLLWCPGVGIELPYLPPHEVVQAEEVGILRPHADLELPHLLKQENRGFILTS